MKKFTWGHGVMVALSAFIIFILSMIFFFTRGWDNSELITDDYYEEELKYQDVIDAKNNAGSLVEKPTYQQDADGIKIVFPKDINNTNSTFSIDMHRPEDKNLDIEKKLTLDATNALYIPGNVLVKGGYILRVHWTKEKKEYQIDYDLVW